MRSKILLVAALVGLTFFYVNSSSAAPLTEAHVTKIINQVKLLDPASGAREAKLDDVIRGELALTTGVKSRSELLFPDNTLTRLGPESYFSFKTGTRDMTLQKGTMLLQVPKGLGGAKIHSASITATITGTTIMMEYVPQKEIKVLVLEGTLRLSNGRFGDSLLLTPGKMVIMPPSARRIPDPVTVDLKKVVQTSTLVNMRAKKGQQATASDGTLPSMSKIETEVERQQTGKDAHRLIDTNLVILGKGTNVVLGSDDLMHDLSLRTDVEKTETVASSPPAPPIPVPTPIPAPTPNSNPPPSGTPPPPPPAVYVTDNTTTIATQNSSGSITTQGVVSPAVIYKDLPTNGSPSGFLFAGPSNFDNAFDFDNFYLQQFKQSAVFVFDSLQLGGGIKFSLSGEINNVAIVGDNGITNSAAAVNLSGVNDILFATKAGSITLNNAVSFATSGDKPNLVQFYARGGDVNIGSSFTLAHTDLRFAAEDNALFNASASITSKNLAIVGLQTMQFDGSANISSTFQLNGGGIQIGGSITAQNSFLFGTSATVNGTLNGGALTANVNGNFLLGATGLLSNTDKTQITAGGIAQFDGTVNAPSSDLNVSGVTTVPNTPGILVNGSLTTKSFDFEPTGDFLLNASGSLTSSGNLTVDATNGAITLDGTVKANNSDFHPTGNFDLQSTGSLNLTGHLNINSGQMITIAGAVTAHDVDLQSSTDTDFSNTSTVNLSGHLQINAGGSINLSGTVSATNDIQLTAGNSITVQNVSTPSSNFTADAGTFTLNGNITAGKVVLQLSAGFNPGAAGSLISAPNLSITVPTPFVFNTTDSTITRFDPTNLNSLTIHSQSLVLPNNLTTTNSVTLNTTTVAPQSGNTLSINAPNISFQASTAMNGQNGTPLIAPGDGLNLTLTTNDFNLDSALSLNGGDGDISVSNAGGNGGQLDITGHNITLNAAVNATTGQNSINSLFGGNGGTVNLTASNTITLKDKIEVSSNDGNRRRSASGGNINIKSNATIGTAINVSSSAQLLALLNAVAPGPGGSIKFTSAGGTINMNGTAQADRGTIEMTNNGLTGQVNLTNATLMADTIKVGALGDNGTLNIGGGTISADTVLKLYAGGSNGTIDFVNNVTLSGNSAKIIAANTVIINNGKIVTILGPSAADVFTNHPNYTGFGGNGSTTGTFAGKGANTHPLSGAPGY